MKFILNNGEMVLATAGYIGKKAKEGTLLDRMNDFSEAIVGKEMEWIFKPIVDFSVNALSNLGHWFISSLPDIMGYTTIGAGAFIILSSMLGKGSMMKTLSWYTAALILAITILGF